MNRVGIYERPLDPRLKPTWRMLWNQIRTFHGDEANRLAELLVMRGMDRGWSPRQLETLLTRLVERDSSQRPERQRHQENLAQVYGQGSAGRNSNIKCPALQCAKTPAGRERASLVEAGQGNCLATYAVGPSIAGPTRGGIA